MRSISLCVLVSCLCWSCVAQDGQKPPQTPEQKLDAVIGRHVEPVPDSALLKDCRNSLHQWDEWSKVNVPLCQQWDADNARLLKENADLEEEVTSKNAGREMLFGAGLGLGIAVPYLLYRVVKKIWPPSSQHKQLAVLMLGATWVAGAALYAIVSSPRASASMTELRAMVYSLPGVLFAAIGFWWFGRRVVVRLF